MKLRLPSLPPGPGLPPQRMAMSRTPQLERLFFQISEIKSTFFLYGRSVQQREVDYCIMSINVKTNENKIIGFQNM